MNKKSDELTESSTPLDKSEIVHSIQKETKKLTRLPFYKLEELKKQEEKKLKHPHKVKKKEELISHSHTHHTQHAEKTNKKRKVILKKIKEEKYKDDEGIKNSKNELASKVIPNNNSSNPSIMLGDGLKMLKYSVNEIQQKNNRLSKKQRKLQDAENTLSSFMSKEDKSIFYGSNYSNEDSGSTLIFNCKNSNISNKNFNKNSSMSMTSLNANQTNNFENKLLPISSSNVILVKKNDNENKLEILGRKKKRINKYKKAVYKYRFQKKQYILNNLFNFEDNEVKKNNDIQVESNNEKLKDINDFKEINEKNEKNKHFESKENKEAEKNSLQSHENSKTNLPKLIERTEKNELNILTKSQQEHITLNNKNIEVKGESNTITNIIPQGNYNNSNSINQNIQTNLMYNYYYNTSNQGKYNLTNEKNHIPLFQQTPNQNNPFSYNNFYNPYHNQYPGIYSPYYCNNSNPFFNMGVNYNNNKIDFYNKYNTLPTLPNPIYNTNSNFNQNTNYYHTQPQTFNNNFKNKIKDNFILKNKISKKHKKFERKSKTLYHDKLNNNHDDFKPQVNNNSNDITNLINTQNNFKNKEKGFIFEAMPIKTNPMESNTPEFKEYLKSTYNIDKDIAKLEGIEFNEYISKNSDLKKINIKNLQKIAEGDMVRNYIKKFEGIQPCTNINKKIIREYVDQILDSEVDKKVGDFIVKMRDIYYKKKNLNPLKAKRRFVVGMREIEKYLRLEEVKCMFIVPNIEKVEGENSLDERLMKIFKSCEKNKIPNFFGLNKFKLGKLARKKHSSVCIVAFINVEGFEREFRDLIEFCEKYKKLFYEKFNDMRDCFKDNKFINLDLFDVYNKPENKNIN